MYNYIETAGTKSLPVIKELINKQKLYDYSPMPNPDFPRKDVYHLHYQTEIRKYKVRTTMTDTDTNNTRQNRFPISLRNLGRR